jgi:ribosomal protein S18 acetylase RimI-like enzyme
MTKIRKSIKKDLKEISEIFRIESAKKPYFQKWTKKTAFEKINEFFNKDDLFIAIKDNKIVGFVISYIEDDNKKKAYADELWLRQDYQGKGIGSSLMKFIENMYKNKGVEIIQLIAKKQAGAFKFYKKLKYKESDENVFLVKRLK